MSADIVDNLFCTAMVTSSTMQEVGSAAAVFLLCFLEVELYFL